MYSKTMWSRAGVQFAELKDALTQLQRDIPQRFVFQETCPEEG